MHCLWLQQNLLSPTPVASTLGCHFDGMVHMQIPQSCHWFENCNHQLIFQNQSSYWPHWYKVCNCDYLSCDWKHPPTKHLMYITAWAIALATAALVTIVKLFLWKWKHPKSWSIFQVLLFNFHLLSIHDILFITILAGNVQDLSLLTYSNIFFLEFNQNVMINSLPALMLTLIPCIMILSLVPTSLTIEIFTFIMTTILYIGWSTSSPFATFASFSHKL